MNAIWQLWDKALPNELCDEIITECEYYKVQDATVGSDVATKNNKVRSSTVRWIEPTDVNSKFIHDILFDYATQANRKAFGFNITSLHQIQYTIYNGEQQDFYDWHFDTFWANSSQYDRKISITVQLSDPEDYEGGDFKFDKQYIQPNAQELRNRGTVLAFPSVISHCVKPVTKGVRKSLVAWIEGPKWK